MGYPAIGGLWTKVEMGTDIQSVAFCQEYDKAARERTAALGATRFDPDYPDLTAIGDDIQKVPKWHKHQDWLTYGWFDPYDPLGYRVQMFVDSTCYPGGFNGEVTVTMYLTGTTWVWYPDLEHWFNDAGMWTTGSAEPRWSFRRIAGTTAGEYVDWPTDPLSYSDEKFYDAPYWKVLVGDYLQGAWLYHDLQKGYNSLIWTRVFMAADERPGGEIDDEAWVDSERSIGGYDFAAHSEATYAAIQTYCEAEYDAWEERPQDANQRPLAYCEVYQAEPTEDEWYGLLDRVHSKAQARITNECECFADFYIVPAVAVAGHASPPASGVGTYYGNGDFPNGDESVGKLWNRSTVRNTDVDTDPLTWLLLQSDYIGTDPDPQNYPAWHPDPPNYTWVAYGYIVLGGGQDDINKIVLRWPIYEPEFPGFEYIPAG